MVEPPLYGMMDDNVVCQTPVCLAQRLIELNKGVPGAGRLPATGSRWCLAG